MVKGILGDTKFENCKAKALKFLKETIEIDVMDEEILVTHRKGTKAENSDINRQMLIRCQPQLKEWILQNKENLKDKRNGNDEKFFVFKQLPDAYMEQECENREIIKNQKDRDQGLQPSDKSKIEEKNKSVYIDGQIVEKQLLPPEPMELFVDKTEKDKMDRIKFATSDMASFNGSDFIAFAVKTGQMCEVRRAYHKIKHLHPSADHIVAAYNLCSNSGYQDDGELGSGHHLCTYLKESRPINTAVYVVRYKNGENLGPTRHEIMEQVVEQAMTRIK